MKGKDLRIVFMGTPEFAVASLRRLVEEGYNIVAVVTTPDKPAGRGQKLHESDVKVAARELGLPILQPEKLRDPEFVEAMQALKPDLGIVIAFRMLPEVIWAMPKYGTFNLHASLLPQHREPILPEDNIGTMYDKLMTKGCDLVVDTVERIAAQDFTPIEQMHIDESTLKPAPKIFKEDCKIDWSWKGERIVNFVRGLSPYPAAWSPMYLAGEEKGSAKIFHATFTAKEHDAKAGTIRTDGKGTMEVACADGWIAIHELQVAGKRRMATRDLLLGFRNIEDYTM